MSSNPNNTDFSSNTKGLTSPASIHLAISPPSATWTVDTAPRAFHCNAAGSLVIKDFAGTNATYEVLQGEILPLESMQQVVSGPDVVAWW
jgi:hypothetical protein